MRNVRRHVVHIALVVLAAALAGSSVRAEEIFEDWVLEPGISQAHLVMVARVASISRLTIVEGAKTDVALREYRFQPVRKLKGIFQREQLSMTAADLGCPADDPALACPLKEGEYRLLILAQQQGRFLGCVSAAPGATSFAERVPLLSGPDDPLVGAVETLIQVADSRSRKERAVLLVKRLEEVEGSAAVPLLNSLRLRADWAAADPRALPALAKLARDDSPAARGAALAVIRDVLASGVAPGDLRPLGDLAGSLRTLLHDDTADTQARLAALEILGQMRAHGVKIAWAQDELIAQLSSAETYAERAVAAAALARVVHPKSTTAVLDALTKLPLDELPARELVYARAAAKLDAAGAERALLARLERAIRAHQLLQAKIEPLGRMRSKSALPLLLTAAEQPALAPIDRYEIARALGRLGDVRAVPVLARWMRETDYQLKEFALAALESLDTENAARELRPLLKTEAHLPFKLRIARVLARHHLADGYALATEHLADASETASATLILIALDDPRTAKDLTAIIAARPDRRWHAAALAGLVAIGDAQARQQLQAILADDRNPLTADAAEAVGLVADADLIRPLATLAQSRNRQIALSSLTALRRFFSDVRNSPRGLGAVNDLGSDEPAEAPRPPAVAPETRAAVFAAVTTLALDAYVDPNLRLEAFSVARLLRGDRYTKLLTDLTDQAELEGTPMLAQAQAELRAEGTRPK